MGRKKTKLPRPTPFSERMALLRKGQGLTMQVLGAQVGITASYISLLECGVRHPSREIVVKLAQAFFPEGDEEVTNELLMLAGFSPIQKYPLEHPRDLQTLYEHILEACPQDFRTYTALIRVLLKEGRFEQAQEKIHEGFRRFRNSYQLQCLLANLELAQGQFSAALVAQESAIRHFQEQAQDKGQLKSPDMADLLINLGVIYFLRGFSHYGQALADAQHRQALEAALADFRTAEQQFEKALKRVPGDIYLLDEYARVGFNIANLSPAGEAAALWGEAIQRFRRVLCAENCESLGYAALMEAGAFLAHSYSKSGRFEEAEAAICLMLACRPQYWLPHYVKACFFCLKYEKEKNGKLLDQALQSLKRAISIEDPKNTARSEATHDPDLQVLRRYRKKEWTNIIEPAGEIMHEK